VDLQMTGVVTDLQMTGVVTDLNQTKDVVTDSQMTGVVADFNQSAGVVANSQTTGVGTDIKNTNTPAVGEPIMYMNPVSVATPMDTDSAPISTKINQPANTNTVVDSTVAMSMTSRKRKYNTRSSCRKYAKETGFLD